MICWTSEGEPSSTRPAGAQDPVRLVIPRGAMIASMATAALLGGTAVGVGGLVSIGLAGAARRAGFARPRGLAAGVAAGLGLWLGATAALAEGGVLGVWTARPPRLPLLPLIALATFILLGRTGPFRRLLAEAPRLAARGPPGVPERRGARVLAALLGRARTGPGHVRGAELRRPRRPHGTRSRRSWPRPGRPPGDDRLEHLRPGGAARTRSSRRPRRPPARSTSTGRGSRSPLSPTGRSCGFRRSSPRWASSSTCSRSGRPWPASARAGVAR